MTEIPEDIMVRAEAAYDALGRGSGADAQVIARAILAERKRCVDLARERVFDDHALAQATDIGRGCHLAASEIVEAIEAGQ